MAEGWISAVKRNMARIGLLAGLAGLVGVMAACELPVLPALLRSATPTASATPVPATPTAAQPTPSPTRTLKPTAIPATATPVRLSLPGGRQDTVAVLALQATPTVEITPQPGDHATLTLSDPTEWSIFAPNEMFMVTWGLRNTGSTTWDGTYRLIFAGGEFLTQTSALTSPMVKPGETQEYHVWLKAPSDTGVYETSWMLVDPFGKPILKVYFRFKVRVM